MSSFVLEPSSNRMNGTKPRTEINPARFGFPGRWLRRQIGVQPQWRLFPMEIAGLHCVKD